MDQSLLAPLAKAAAHAGLAGKFLMTDPANFFVWGCYAVIVAADMGTIRAAFRKPSVPKMPPEARRSARPDPRDEFPWPIWS